MKEFLSTLYTKTGKLDSNKCKDIWFVSNGLQKYLNEIYNRTSFLEDDVKLSVRINCVLQNIKEIPSCRVCDNPVKWNKSTAMFQVLCSKKCMHLDVITRKKIEDTKEKRYGSSKYNNREKSKETCIKKFGVDNIFKLDGSLERFKQIKLERYGDCNYNNREKYKETLQNSTVEKKNAFSKKISEIQHNLFYQSCSDIVVFKYLFVPFIKSNRNLTNQELADVLNISKAYLRKLFIQYGVYDIYIQHNISLPENIIKDYFLRNSISFIRNDRIVLDGKELDFYLPEHSLAIECNGVYWHSELNGKGKKYHLDKTQKCNENNIQLLHFFDSEILKNTDIVLSMISSKLGLSNRIYARKCKIMKIDMKTAKEFCINNHIQGYVPSKTKLGLYYKNKLVAVMTFGKSRFNKTYDWELLRFCNLSGYSVIGGASKLFTYFKRNYNGTILSYANKRWSNGNLYEKLNMTMLNESAPNYFYTKDYRVLESRNKYQKHKLKKLLEYNKNVSEWENMKMNGYDRVWDCGNFVFGC